MSSVGRTVDEIGDDGGQRVRAPSSTVLVAALVHRNGQENGETAARLQIPSIESQARERPVSFDRMTGKAKRKE
jgi:hypothetical protein